MTQSLTNIPALPYNQAAIEQAANLWVTATTANSASAVRNLPLKLAAVRDFFDYAQRHPADITPADVAAWRDSLVCADSTRYQRVSLLASFYTYLMRTMPDQIRYNPAAAARPKAPKAYTSEKAKALTDDEMGRLVAHVAHLASHEDHRYPARLLTHKRDYALLMVYLKRGMRRESVIEWRWRDVTAGPKRLEFTTIVKGGERRTFEIDDAEMARALRDYVRATGGRQANDWVWWAHDPDATRNQRVTSSAVSQNMKRYAAAVGISEFWMHRTRHTYARIVNAEGTMGDTQDALDHVNQQTTRIYAGAVGVKRDRGYSASVTRRLEKKEQ